MEETVELSLGNIIQIRENENGRFLMVMTDGTNHIMSDITPQDLLNIKEIVDNCVDYASDLE